MNPKDASNFVSILPAMCFTEPLGPMGKLLSY